MPVSFLPKAIFPKLTEISLEYLQKHGVELLMLDFDNTVLPYTSNELTGELLAWAAQIRSAGIRLCVVSNSKKPRCLPFCEQTGSGCIRSAKKPFSGGIKACLSRYGMQPAQAALVGDQIFTDVLGANCAGVRSILVEPIHLHNVLLRARHALEQPFIHAARRKNRK